MEKTLILNNKEFTLKRYPKTTDTSLRAWSNAELLTLDYIADKETESIHLYNDRFGIWNCALANKNITSVFTYASQHKAVLQNLESNQLSDEIQIVHPLDELKDVELALVKIPKSAALFELFLQQIHKGASEHTEVVCCFMTKYFSASFLKIASSYFEVNEQSKAWKKARLLILKQPKKQTNYKNLINTITFNNTEYQQYFGVFSSDKIDIGTQFLLEHLQIENKELNILDLACGNGVIAKEITKQNPKAQLSLIDDFNIAIASAKINLSQTNATFVCDNNLNSFSENTFDLVVSNPPFHFEHENNIEVSLSLFKQVQYCLKNEGKFTLVANKHLNYKTHLSRLFHSIKILNENSKFILYECLK